MKRHNLLSAALRSGTAAHSEHDIKWEYPAPPRVRGATESCTVSKLTKAPSFDRARHRSDEL